MGIPAAAILENPVHTGGYPPKPAAIILEFRLPHHSKKLVFICKHLAIYQ